MARKKTVGIAKSTDKANSASRSKKAAAQSDYLVCELNQPVWAIANGSECFASGLNYADAVGKSRLYPESIIITAAAALRLIAAKPE